jgi:hypothetical protein
VLNVPVWQYGISVGTVVDASPLPNGRLKFVRVVRDSPGATVRFVVPEPAVASDVYMNRIHGDAARQGLEFGPATIYDPGLVAFNVRERAWLSTAVEKYLDSLIAGGVISHWEVGDPDPEPVDPNNPAPHERGDELVHEHPADGQ